MLPFYSFNPFSQSSHLFCSVPTTGLLGPGTPELPEADRGAPPCLLPPAERGFS